MSPEKQRIAIAEACGLNPVEIPFVPRDVEPGHNGRWFSPEAAAHMRATYPRGANPKIIPDYLNSLDAMHSAEKVLTGKQQRDYATAIGIAAGRGYVFPCYEQGGFNLLHTTAPQRAEAFLKTLGLWESPTMEPTQMKKGPTESSP